MRRVRKSISICDRHDAMRTRARDLDSRIASHRGSLASCEVPTKLTRPTVDLRGERGIYAVFRKCLIEAVTYVVLPFPDEER